MYATPTPGIDPKYDAGQRRGRIALTLHRDDGTTEPVELVMNPDEVETHQAILVRLIEKRRVALATGLEDR